MTPVKGTRRRKTTVAAVKPGEFDRKLIKFLNITERNRIYMEYYLEIEKEFVGRRSNGLLPLPEISLKEFRGLPLAFVLMCTRLGILIVVENHTPQLVNFLDIGEPVYSKMALHYWFSDPQQLYQVNMEIFKLLLHRF